MTTQVSSDSRSGVDVYRLQDGGAHADIVPAWGDSCVEWTVSGHPVLEPVAWSDLAAKPTSFGIPLLLPFPNRLRDAAFSFEGERFEVPPGRHGFVRDKAWRVIDTGATPERGAWITCGFDAADHEESILRRFPFPFQVEVTHRVRAALLELTMVVHNRGSRAMPFGFGIHPYFARPAHGTITVPAAELWQLDDSLPTGGVTAVGPALDLRHPRDVAALVADDIYTRLTPESDGLVRCRLDDDDSGFRTTVEFDLMHFPHVVVYTVPAPRAAICIEPYTCPTDGFNLVGRGIDESAIRLHAGESRGMTIVMRHEPLAL